MKLWKKDLKLPKKPEYMELSGNIFLLLLKAIVGFTSKSQAMIADSINSAGFNDLYWK